MDAKVWGYDDLKLFKIVHLDFSTKEPKIGTKG
jgi:hypothetical protein